MPHKLILEALENIKEADFDKFKWHLTFLEDPTNLGIQPIPQSLLENRSRCDVTTKMVEVYCDKAVEVTVNILKMMQLNKPATTLIEKFASRSTNTNAGPSTTSSNGIHPSAAQSISAQHGSVVIAPTVGAGMTGSVNITINKP